MAILCESPVEREMVGPGAVKRARSAARRSNVESTARWYVAQTHPRRESVGLLHLERQQFRCFLPRFTTARQQVRRPATARVPLFPGYIFVEFCPSTDRWQAINGTIGIRRLVGSSEGRPTPMPAAAMCAIFERCEGNEVQRLVPDLRAGDQVRINAGPFADQLASIESLDHGGRVRVLLDILGRATRVAIPLRDVGPI